MTHTNTDTTTSEPKARPSIYGTPGAFVRRTSRARSTGANVEIVDLFHEDGFSECDPALTEAALERQHRWGVSCEHELTVTYENLRDASAAASSPEAWCDECAAVVERRRSTPWSRVAKFTGLSESELSERLGDVETCPLCIEVGGENHSSRRCLNALDAMADRSYSHG